MNKDQIKVSYQYRKQFSVMVRAADCLARVLGSKLKLWGSQILKRFQTLSQPNAERNYKLSGDVTY